MTPRTHDGVKISNRALRAAALALACLLASPSRAEAWGFTAHRLVNRLAIGTLPEPLRAFFAGNGDYVAEHSVDPDLQRDSPDDPNHFLDMDAFGAYPFSDIPRIEAEHLKRHGPEAAAQGRLPWRIEEVSRDLREAFRAGDAARSLALAASLGHYVADGHVPLHAALNHDGQLTGQRGLHGRWESEMVERFERQLQADLRPAPASPVGDPVGFAFDALASSHAASVEVLASDRESAGERDLAETPEDDRYDDSYYSRLYEREAARLRERLSRSATGVGSLWLSAWLEAGRPPLDTAFRFPYVRRGSRAILVSLDGAAAMVLDDAVARGVMPHLAGLRRSGSVTKGALSSLPAKTASGHAALYTGAWSDANGIGGNELPVPGATVLDRNTGYSSTHLRAEPIWVTAARQDLDVTVASATQVHPFSTYFEERRFRGYLGRRLTLLDGYQNLEAADAVYTAADLPSRAPAGWISHLPRHAGEAREIELAVSGSRVDGLLFDDPGDPTRGLDSLYLGLDKDPRGGVTLKPMPVKDADASAFGGLALKAGGGQVAVYFRLFALSPDGSEILLYRSGPSLVRSNKPGTEAAAFPATGGFVGNGGSGVYERGLLGPPLWEGGDGTAERRYLETVALVGRQLTRLTDFAIDHTAWHLLLTYLPYPDEALHLWHGRLDPSLPGHDPRLAARLRPFMDAVLRVADGFVGHLHRRAGAETILAVASDHGMTGVARTLKPNVALRRAGLLTLDADRRVDLARTRAVYFPGNSGYVLINGAGRKGGIVRPQEEDAVRAEVAAVFRGLRDPATGQPVVLDLIDSRTPTEPGIGGPTGGDLYLSIAPGYALSGDLAGEVLESTRPKGDHVLNPERPELKAGFVVAGPGVSIGADLGGVRLIDIAPTLCALLGIDPPAHATGAVLARALARLTRAAPNR